MRSGTPISSAAISNTCTFDGAMILTIARKEFLEMTRDGRARLAALLVFALLGASILIGWKQYREIRSEVEAARRTVRNQWLHQAPKGPHQAAHYGTYAFKPRTALSLADIGVNRYTGVALFLEPHRQNDFRFRPAQDATVLERFGQMTASVTLQILIPLLIVMLTFGSFAGERESGTLRQVLSAGVKPIDLAWGKLLGATAVLAIFLAPATALGVAAILGNTLAAGEWDGVWRAVFLLGGFLLYFGAWSALCIAVSASCRSARLALIVLLTFWIGNCLVAPRVMADIASRLHPSGSALERYLQVTREAREGPDGHDPGDPHWKARKQELLKQHNVASVADLPFNFDGLVAVEAEKYTTDVYRRHFENVWMIHEAQDRTYRLGGLVAPMLAIQSLSMGLAGTDSGQQRHFATAAESYRSRMAIAMNSYIMTNVRYGDRQMVAGPELWKSLPDFEYMLPDTRWVLARHSLSIGVLAAWFAGSVVIAVWRAGRVRPA